MEDRINHTLSQLEKDLQEINSARSQVESTVKASTELQNVVSEYVSSVQALCIGLQTWETNLTARGESLSHEYEAAVSRVNSTCTEIINSFGTVVEQTSTDFKSKTYSVIEKFIEQNKNLAGHVGQLKSLHDSLKKATDEVANIKKTLEILSKDLKDSQELQDTVLDDINKKVEEIPVTGKGYKDEIVAKIDSVETKLDTLQSELSQVNTLCQGIKSSSVELNSLMNSSTKALSNTILQSKEDILKSIKTNRLILMAGLIIAGEVVKDLTR
jgi:chromosome segregation ATPase